MAEAPKKLSRFMQTANNQSPGLVAYAGSPKEQILVLLNFFPSWLKGDNHIEILICQDAVSGIVCGILFIWRWGEVM